MADYNNVASKASQIIAAAIDNFGRVDGLVCNAGVHAIAGFGQLTGAQIDVMFGVHQLGSINTARAAWPYTAERGFGRIVNTSSAAIFGTAGASIYQVCNSAIFTLTKAQAADGAAAVIKANTILPYGYSRMAESQPGLASFLKQNSRLSTWVVRVRSALRRGSVQRAGFLGRRRSRCPGISRYCPWA